MVEFNPFSWETHENPYPVYRALRDEAPVYRNEELGFWALSRHDDVLMALRDPERFSSANGVALEAMGPEAHRVMSFLAMDPPRHDRMRALVSRGFTPRRVRDLEPRIRELANRYIDRVIDKGQCDFIDDFAGKIPMDVISEMIGVPQHDRDMVRAWADLVVHREEGDPTDAGGGHGGLRRDARLLHPRRGEGAGRTGAATPSPTPSSRRRSKAIASRILEIVGFLFLMSIAGNETTTKLLGNALYWLQHCPDQRAMVDADPRLVENWVEETLRFDASSQILYRTVTEDVELHGRTMKARRLGCAHDRLGQSRRARLPGPRHLRHHAGPEAEPGLRPGHPLLPRAPPWRGSRGGRPWRRCTGACGTSRSTPRACSASTRATCAATRRCPFASRPAAARRAAEAGPPTRLHCTRPTRRAAEQGDPVAELDGEKRNLIDGQLVDASNGATFDNVNPATEEVIGVCADGTKEDMDSAIAAARRAFDETSWSTDPAFRQKCLSQLCEALARPRSVCVPS